MLFHNLGRRVCPVEGEPSIAKKNCFYLQVRSSEFLVPVCMQHLRSTSAFPRTSCRQRMAKSRKCCCLSSQTQSVVVNHHRIHQAVEDCVRILSAGSLYQTQKLIVLDLPARQIRRPHHPRQSQILHHQTRTSPWVSETLSLTPLVHHRIQSMQVDQIRQLRRGKPRLLKMIAGQMLRTVQQQEIQSHSVLRKRKSGMNSGYRIPRSNYRILRRRSLSYLIQIHPQQAVKDCSRKFHSQLALIESPYQKEMASQTRHSMTSQILPNLRPAQTNQTDSSPPLAPGKKMTQNQTMCRDRSWIHRDPKMCPSTPFRMRTTIVQKQSLLPRRYQIVALGLAWIRTVHCFLR
mmetsp:Transcript_17828/g.25744  ORF Transcript_17828/g.25744 Transcript_17828/m.25744 type:complete len:347 (+) Transcript_17828:633-1673(+)